MEKYIGIKFQIHKAAETFTTDTRLAELNYWIYLFGELGLAPVHPEGAYGNHSYRRDGNSFIITRTGMRPAPEVNKEDYCEVLYDNEKNLFNVKGKNEPSSECFLHSALYRSFPQVQVIMHGHSSLLTSHAQRLNIAVTEKEYPYGTAELAASAVQVCDPQRSFFILKNHGFVATGKDIDGTAKSVLHHYSRLLSLLQDM